MTTTTTRRKAQRPTMTPEQATSFERISVANATIILACRKCQCQPYEDWFTFRRWKAQGYHVRKGEKGLRLPLVKDVDKLDEDDNIISTTRILGASYVFCRCQVEENGKGES